MAGYFRFKRATRFPPLPATVSWRPRNALHPIGTRVGIIATDLLPLIHFHFTSPTHRYISIHLYHTEKKANKILEEEGEKEKKNVSRN